MTRHLCYRYSSAGGGTVASEEARRALARVLRTFALWHPQVCVCVCVCVCVYVCVCV